MKKFALLVLATLTLGLCSCEKEKEFDNEEQPRVELKLVTTGNNSVSFEVTTENAKSARYMLLGNEEEAPALETILEVGEEITLNEEGKAVVMVESLEPETSYKIIAAVKNVAKKAGSREDELPYKLYQCREDIICCDVGFQRDSLCIIRSAQW